MSYSRNSSHSVLIISDTSCLSKDEHKSLINQEVILDDCDFLFFVDSSVEMIEEEDEDFGEPFYYPRDYVLSRIFSDSSHNHWFLNINFKGRKYHLGAAYHS